MMQSKVTSQDKALKKHKANAINRKAATRKFGTRLVSRTKRVAVLVADTGYELCAACETVREMDQLYSGLGMADDVPDNAMHRLLKAV